MQDDTNAFEKQAVKTNILFNNPHWLNFQLKETGLMEELIKERQSTPLDKPSPVETQEVDDLPDNTDAPNPENFRPEKEIEPMKLDLKILNCFFLSKYNRLRKH